MGCEAELCRLEGPRAQELVGMGGRFYTGRSFWWLLKSEERSHDKWCGGQAHSPFPLQL